MYVRDIYNFWDPTSSQIIVLKKMMPKTHEFLLGASILVASSSFFSSRLCASALTSEEFSMQLTRAELVRLAGYGEERISSVLVAGTLLCDACLRPGSDPVTFPVPGHTAFSSSFSLLVLKQGINHCIIEQYADKQLCDVLDAINIYIMNSKEPS